MKNIIVPTFKSFLFKILLLALCIFSLWIAIGISNFGCSEGNESIKNSRLSEMIIGQTDRGNNFDIAQGSIISIRLKENPTTGYEWEISEIDSRIVKLQDSEYIGASQTALGSGGLRIFTFKAKSPGVTQIRLKLRREWEPEKTAIDHFEVTLRVIKAE